MNIITKKLDLKPLSNKDLLYYVVLFYLISLCATHGGVVTAVRVLVLLTSILALIFPVLIKRSMYWLSIAIIFSTNLIPNYANAANHYYLTLYTLLFISLLAYRNEIGSGLKINISRVLLVITFGFATFHKILSGYFLSGRLLADYALKGSSFFNTFSFIYGDKWEQTVQAYRDSSAELASNTHLGAMNFPIDIPGDSFIQICQILALSVILIELIIFLSLLINKSFNSRFLPYLLLSFLWGTMLIRNEYSFFSLVCILFLFSKPDLKPILKLLFILSIGIFLAFDMSSLGVKI